MLLAIQGYTQILKPAKWTIDVSNKKAGFGEEVDLIFNVKIDRDWYLYSTDFDSTVGPMVTEFDFVADGSFELIGGIQPIGSKRKYDSLWEGEYTYFKKTAKFIQKIKIINEQPVIKGSYAYQVCTDVDGKCIPFDDEFDFSKFFLENVSNDNKIKSYAKSNPEDEEEGLLSSRGSNDPYSLLAFMIAAFLAGGI